MTTQTVRGYPFFLMTGNAAGHRMLYRDFLWWDHAFPDLPVADGTLQLRKRDMPAVREKDMFRQRIQSDPRNLFVLLGQFLHPTGQRTFCLKREVARSAGFNRRSSCLSVNPDQWVTDVAGIAHLLMCLVIKRDWLLDSSGVQKNPEKPRNQHKRDKREEFPQRGLLSKTAGRSKIFRIYGIERREIPENRRP